MEKNPKIRRRSFLYCSEMLTACLYLGGFVFFLDSFPLFRFPKPEKYPLASYLAEEPGFSGRKNPADCKEQHFSAPCSHSLFRQSFEQPRGRMAKAPVPGQIPFGKEEKSKFGLLRHGGFGWARRSLP